MLDDDPLIESVGAVVFDEFHEREYYEQRSVPRKVRRIQQTVASRTQDRRDVGDLDSVPLAAFWAYCRVVASEGRQSSRSRSVNAGGFMRSRPLGAGKSLGGGEASRRTNHGDYLVFLPGVGEIRQSAAELQTL